MNESNSWIFVNRLFVIFGFLVAVFACVIAFLSFVFPDAARDLIIQFADSTPQVVIVYKEVTVEPTRIVDTPSPTNTALPTNTPKPTATYTPVPPTSTPTPDLRLFYDDFDSGVKSEWEIMSGHCTMRDGRLICTEGNSRLEAGDYNWTNYVVEFDTGSYWIPGWAAFLMNINEDGSYLKIHFPVCHSISWTYHDSDGVDHHITKGNGSVCEDGPFRIRVESNNGIFTVRINGNIVSTIQEDRSRYGRIGFIVSGPWFDNVTVSASSR